MNTGVLGELSQPGDSLYNIEHSNNGLITFPGGVPVKDASGQIIGAIGVSGSSVANDHAEQLNEVTGLIESGRIKPIIDKVYTLSDAVKALQHVVKGRTKGKVVIKMK